jgi:D-alanyl-D-alanine carboxypeptidase
MEANPASVTRLMALVVVYTHPRSRKKLSVNNMLRV